MSDVLPTFGLPVKVQHAAADRFESLDDPPRQAFPAEKPGLLIFLIVIEKLEQVAAGQRRGRLRLGRQLLVQRREELIEPPEPVALDDFVLRAAGDQEAFDAGDGARRVDVIDRPAVLRRIERPDDGVVAECVPADDDVAAGEIVHQAFEVRRIVQHLLAREQEEIRRLHAPVHLQDLDARFLRFEDLRDRLGLRFAANQRPVVAKPGIVERLLEKAVEIERDDDVEEVELDQLGQLAVAGRRTLVEVGLEHQPAMLVGRSTPELVEAIVEAALRALRVLLDQLLHERLGRLDAG